MNALLHLLAIAHGLFASLLCFVVFYAAGIALLPARWEGLRRGGTPVAMGAAAYVLAAWYGIQWGIRLTPLAVTFAVASLVAASLRARAWKAGVRASVQALPAWRTPGLFAALYVLAYVFTLPPVSGDRLPIAWLGNVDLFQYLVYVRHLQRLGVSPIADVSSHAYVYRQTPAAFYMLGAFSVPFGEDVLRAAMPALFASVALGGLVVARAVRRLFGVAHWAAAIVAAGFFSGPFCRMLAGHYYLSTLMALPVMLHLLVFTAVQPARRAWLDTRLLVAFFAHYVLLLFLYPYLCLVTAGFHAALVLLLAASAWQDGEPARAVLSAAGSRAVAALAAVGALVACAPTHIAWVGRMLRELSRPGLWGWPLDVISPLALFGLPGVLNRIQAPYAGPRWLLTAALWALGIGSFAPFLFRRVRRSTTGLEQSFLALAGLGFILYAGYFALVGPSYQQWKLASYTALPLSFVGTALVVRLLLGPRAAGETHRLRAWRAPAVVVLGLLIVGGNLFAHAVGDPRFLRRDGDLRRLATVGALSPARDLSISVPNVTMALLAAYFIPDKRLHVSSPSFHASEPVVLADVSRVKPLLLLDYACDGVGHGETHTIEGVGCLLLQPPSLAADTGYPFERNFLFIETSGLTRREAGGRWNRAGQVRLTLMADQRVLQLERDAAWVNLLLEPALMPGVAGQRLRLTWGAARRGEALLGVREWISLPLRIADWPATRVTSQSISVELPDILPPHWIDGPQGRYLESRPLAVRFVELSVSGSPRGRVIQPAE